MNRMSLFATVAFGLLIPGAVGAQTWTGAVSGNWSNPNNWSPVGVPTSGPNTQLVFGATANTAMTDDIAGTFNVNQLTFSSGGPAYTLGGNGLSFQISNAGGAPQIVTTSTNNVTLNTPMPLTDNLSVNGIGNFAINGAIGGIGGLTTVGTGIVTLGNSSNSYSGGTNAVNGTIQVSADAALGTGNISGTSAGTANFNNPIAGTFGWSLDQSHQTLSLIYTPTAVPEPGTLALAAVACLGLARTIRRRHFPLTTRGSYD
jgi:hypothetical protein